MVNRITETAYAKINLCLDITGRLENGYHTLDGVMQTVTLGDTVTVEFEPSDRTCVTLTAEGNSEMPTDSRNIACRAAERLLDLCGRKGTVHIHLVKKIPMGGGLAGGSTDAAAVLRILNRLAGNPLTPHRLLKLGASLGADVPFCLYGGTARTEGIGDVLTPLPELPACYIVIAKRGDSVSTPWAYGKLDELYHRFDGTAARPDAQMNLLLHGLNSRSLDEVCRASYNIFEDTVSKIQKDVPILKTALTEQGALLARMSGSGPSVFGIFETSDVAEKAKKLLSDLGAEAEVCQPISPKFL